MNEVSNTQSTPVNKKRGFWKICGIIIGIIILMIIGLYGFLQFKIKTVRDIEPFDDPALKLQSVQVSVGDNAFNDLEEISELLVYPKDKSQSEKLDNILDGKEWDESFVNDLVEKNKSALDALNKANEKPKFQDPAFADPSKITYKTIGGPLGSLRQIVKIKSLQAELELRQGKPDEALDDALKIVGIGQKLEDSQGILIAYLVDISVKKTGLTRIDHILATNRNDLKNLNDFKNKLSKYQNDKEGLKTAIKVEYIIFSSGVDYVSSGLLKNSEKNSKISELFNNLFYFQPNKTKKLYADWTTTEIANVDKPCSNIIRTDREDISKLPKWKLIWHENAAGEIMFNSASEAREKLQNKRCEMEEMTEKIIQEMQ